MKFKEIIVLAERTIVQVETKKSASLSKTQNYTTLAYLFSKSILNLGKDIGVKYVPQNSNPQSTHINGGIGIKNCFKLCELMVNWVEKHNEAPSYLRFNDKKIGIWVWTYATARILAYYNKTGKLPQKQIVTDVPFKKKETPKKTYKKYGHATRSGCDNMGQNTPYFCGVHSLQEVFRNLTGIVVSQSTLASVAGTTTDGTDHDGLNTAVAWFNRNYNKNLKVEWKNFSDLGWGGIKKIVDSSNQDCVIHNCYRNQWGHYEVINNVSDNITVQNSLGDSCGDCYCGYIEYRTQSEFRSYINGISQKSIMVITNDS